MKKNTFLALLTIATLTLNSCENKSSEDKKEDKNTSENTQNSTDDNSGSETSGDYYSAFNYIYDIGLGKDRNSIKNILNLPKDANIISDDDTGLDVQFFKNDLIHHITIGFFGQEKSQDFEIHISGGDDESLQFIFNEIKQTLQEQYQLPIFEDASSCTWYTDYFGTGNNEVSIYISLKNGVFSYVCYIISEGV
jgi:hypothetical protein